MAAIFAACEAEERHISLRPPKDRTESSYSWYASAISYPEGSDWREEGEPEGLQIILFADGKPIKKIPAGKKHETGIDSDMHIIAEGCIYTWYSNGNDIVVKKDGKELFRYYSDERIINMEVLNEDIYTLGMNSTRKGFVLRKNGDVLLDRAEGDLFPGMQTEDGLIHFFHSVGEGSKTFYHNSSDGRSEKIEMNADKVFDIVWHKGSIWCIASLSYQFRPLLIKDGYIEFIEEIGADEIMYARLIPAGETVYVEAAYRFMDTYSRTSLWRWSQRHHNFQVSSNVNGICGDEKGVCCVVNPWSEGGQGLIYRFDRSSKMPEGYIIFGSSSLSLIKGKLYVGLSSVRNEKPLVWVDGETVGLDIKGYICRISGP